MAPSSAGPEASLSERLSGVCTVLRAEVRALRAAPAGRTPVIGLCGAQGSGKSTLARVLRSALQQQDGLAVALLSLDDLYLPSVERRRLAATVHPLLRTRGVPGTHDIALGIELVHRLCGAAPEAITRLPRFDKLADDPCAPELWEAFVGPADVVLLEGWCVGARAQAPGALSAAINELERQDDADGRWRRHVNQQLAGPYASFFDLLDYLVLLRAPGFHVVQAWRREQEHELAGRALPGPHAAPMSDSQLERFIQHYERLTRHILEEMPARADLVIELDEQRHITAVRRSGDG